LFLSFLLPCSVSLSTCYHYLSSPCSDTPVVARFDPRTASNLGPLLDMARSTVRGCDWITFTAVIRRAPGDWSDHDNPPLNDRATNWRLEGVGWRVRRDYGVTQTSPAGLGALQVPGTRTVSSCC
jgi:hypothetical protein